MSDSEIEKYISDYLIHEGVQLERSQITVNPALRTVFKTSIICAWGFLALDHKTTSKYISEPEEFFRMLDDVQRYKIKSAHIVNENMLLVRYRDLEIDMTTNPKTSVVHASFVTAYARLTLLKTLRSVDYNNLIYCDTDCIVYRQPPGVSDPIVTGPYLGDLVCELSRPFGPGSYITSFTATAPKSYAYKVRSSRDDKIHEVCRVKGFTLNYANQKVLNFESIKRCVNTPLSSASTGLQTVDHLKMRRNIIDGTIHTVTEVRAFNFNFDKRILKGYETQPYGY